MSPTAPLLEARGLVRRFQARRRGEPPVVAVDAVDVELAAGEVVGLVGESGSGKTTLGKVLLRILEPQGGTLRFEDRDLLSLRPRELRDARARMQMIYQGASACLNPGLTVEQHLRETIALHRPADRARAEEIVDRTLADFRLRGKRTARPRELSGGERRRVGVARCLLPGPSLVVADEPTAGLDASVKSEVLELMLRARAREVTWLFVSHELDIVRYVADRVLVMFRGRIVQHMPAADLDPRGDLADRALHPYCERLLSTAFGARTRVVTPAARAEQPRGCPYLSACHTVDPTSPLWQTCTEQVPRLVQLGGGRRIACHRFLGTK